MKTRSKNMVSFEVTLSLHLPQQHNKNPPCLITRVSSRKACWIKLWFLLDLNIPCELKGFHVCAKNSWRINIIVSGFLRDDLKEIGLRRRNPFIQFSLSFFSFPFSDTFKTWIKGHPFFLVYNIVCSCSFCFLVLFCVRCLRYRLWREPFIR